MSSYADISRQEKFHRFLISSLTTPIASIRWTHFLWGCLTEFPMVSYKMLGLLSYGFTLEITRYFFAK